MQYNKDNIFAKIIRKEIPADIIYEDELLICFNDISPVAPIHALIIPKGEYTDFNDFINNAPPDVAAHYFKKISEIAHNNLGLTTYRIISNFGENSGQTIFHFHMHLISGKEISNLI